MTDFSNFLNMADEAIKNHNISKAIKYLQEAFKINPESHDVCLKLGILTQQLGNLELSKEYFKKSILINSKSSLGYSNLGVIYSKLKQEKLALENYLKALELDPKNFLTNYNLGNYYFSIEDLENAEKYYLSSIRIQPKHFYPYNNLFQIYDRSNKIKKLEQITNQIINTFDGIPIAKFLQGIFEFRKKNYKKTISIFKNLNIDKNDVQRTSLKENILAKSYDFIGLYSEAFKHFSISNEIVQKSIKDKFSKDRYLNLIKGKLDLSQNNFIKSDLTKNTYEGPSDPVFLIGFPRSGTTLLDTILRSHKSLKVLEEKSLVDELIKKLNQIIGGDLSRLHLLNNNTILELRNLYFNKRKDLVGFSNKVVYIDKMPLNILYVAELNKIFPKAKFIFALRNPYDVVLSCFMQPFVPNDAMSNFFNLEDTVKMYDLVMELWKRYEEILLLDISIVKYEDVVCNFDITIKKLIKFINVNWSEELKKFYLNASNRGIIHTPSYNQVNMPLYNQSILRWKNYSDKFSNLDLKLQKWIRIFGY